jgi:ATP-dependent Clp protease ATP-binding subunit ClpA
MFERMTDRVCLCIEHARQIANELRHEAVEPEHLLLGVLKEGGGIACVALQTAGIDLEALREELERRLPPAAEGEPRDKLDLSVGARKALECSFEEAKRLGHHYLGTEHLLLGILWNEAGTAAQVLNELGPGLAGLRQHVLSLVQPAPEAKPSGTPGFADMPSPPIPLVQPAPEAKPSAAGPAPEPNPQGEPAAPKGSPARKGSKASPGSAWIRERATERARKCLENAQQEAARQNRADVGSEHLLLGMLKDENGVACSVLKKFGVDFDQVRRPFQAGPPPAAPAKLPKHFSKEASRCLERAVSEAKALGHEYLGTEHLLLGMLAVTDGAAAKTLMEQGVYYNEARQEILKVLGLEASLVPSDDEMSEEPPAKSDVPKPAHGSTSPAKPSRESGKGSAGKRVETVAGARVKTSYSQEAADLISKIQTLEEEKQKAITGEKFECAGELRDQVLRLTQELEASLKGSHTVTHTFDDETLDAVLRLMDTYWRMKSEGVPPAEILDWLKVNFFRLPEFVVAKRPAKRSAEPEKPKNEEP